MVELTDQQLNRAQWHQEAEWRGWVEMTGEVTEWRQYKLQPETVHLCACVYVCVIIAAHFYLQSQRGIGPL